ncbi:DUF853 family protein, partial [Candidatus Woesearchaeota archaeon]|nr:DUF853 family protein [Candidatus Woesearchaeota archaeon]
MKAAFLGKSKNKDFTFELEGLKKHFIALGGSGSGKTVLCKAIIEEASKNGIPAIIIDPQGDLASLALGMDENVQVVIFTPTSSKGIPLSVNPLKLPKSSLEKEDLISVLSQISSSIAKLLGYDIEKDKGKAAQSLLYTILMDAYSQKTQLSSFEDLAFMVESLDGQAKERIIELVSEKELEAIVKKIRYLTVGEKELLFNFGVPLDIDTLFGKREKKTRVSVIYLNSLETQTDKDFFVSMAATELYKWMLSKPSKDLQGIFYIDEIAPFLPAGARKPLPKPILTLLFKQARKYGIGCIVSTQNPGDIDYKAFAQFGTWAIGRLTTKQDRAKVKDALKSLAGAKTEKIIEKLPKLKPGNFVLFSPDYFDDVVELQVRRLATEHRTLNDSDVKSITDKTRDEFKELVVETKKQAKKIVEGVVVKEENYKTMHFPVNIGIEKAKQIIEKQKKKKFFFKSAEAVQSVELVFEPLIKAKIKAVEKKFMRKEIAEY